MTLDEFNAASVDEARPALLACCDAPRWADSLLEGRPYRDLPVLISAADLVARDLDPADVDRALAAHPRIGERPAADGTAAGWSRQEQAGVDAATHRQALVDANRAYEQKFGRVFLVCADGLSAEEVLASLRSRLAHSPEEEAAVVADELRKIAVLRLRRLVTA